MSKGQKKHDLTIFYILFPPLLAFIFIYFYPIYAIFQIFLSKPLISVLIPILLSIFLMHIKGNLGNIKVTRETKEKAIFYSIFVTFLVFYLVFFSKSTPLILAQTPSCPSGTTCIDVPQCGSMGGTCVASCSDGCCCRFTTCTKDSDCPAIDTDGGNNIYSKGTCYPRYCTPTGQCKIPDGAGVTDECSLTGYGIIEAMPASDYPNTCIQRFYNCPSGHICLDGACVPGCNSDSDCPKYDPNTHLKMYCDTTIHKCTTIGSCSTNTDCEGEWCCDYITGTRECVSKGTILSSGGKSYICVTR
jgi:hypothetical protein